MSRERIGGATLVGGLAAFIVYWIVASLITMSCSSRYYGADHLIEPQETAILIALGFGIAALAFGFVTLNNTQPDKFEKSVALSLLVIVVLWIAFVLLDDQTCSPSAWKHYAAYLIVPCLIGSIAVVGRQWIAQND